MGIREQLNDIAGRHTLVLDGAMGSMIQTLNLTEEDFRGEAFAEHPEPLKGCNDLLCLTRPEAVIAIHNAYLAAGADIIETCSFNATSISLSDYGLGDRAYEISAAAAALARQCADRFSTPDRPRFVAGSIGPTSKSASLSPDVGDLSKRGVYWDELEAAYYDNARGLLDGGVDIFLVETIFDTLNAKAALFAIRRLLEARGVDVPLMISATVQNESGRLLSGQTLEAFCASVSHAGPWAIGLNCSFGAEKLLPHLRRLSRIAPCMVSAHPNAGLPNKDGDYDETPHTMSDHIDPYLKEGLVNVIGGCCGSTPAHIAAISVKAACYAPNLAARFSGKSKETVFLAGLEPLIPGKARPGGFVIVGDGINAAGGRVNLRLTCEDDYDDAADLAQDMVEEGAAIIDFCMDEGESEPDKVMGRFLDMALSNPYIAKVPFMLSSSRWEALETGLKRLQGKGLVNSLNLKEGEGEFLRRAALIGRYGAAAVVTLVDEQGPAGERGIEVADRAYKALVAAGFPPENIVFDPNAPEGGGQNPRACSWIRDNCPGVKIKDP